MTEQDMTQHPDWDGPGTYYVCPLNPDHLIKAIDVEDAVQATLDLEVRVEPGEDPLKALVRAGIEKRAADDEASILMHVELHHSLKETLVALGTARNALLDIRGRTFTPKWGDQYAIEEVISRGLGG